ncbi:MAG: glycosyltransferase [Minwuia sp.]|nr:glycosyltransferase [Minwuia sp.]
MKLLLASASFERAYGGPAYSVSGLAKALALAGAEVGIWAPDGSAVSSDLLREQGTMPGIVPLAGDLRSAVVAFGTPDLFHDSGIWLPHNQAVTRMATHLDRPRVVSTRGMLAPWALRHKWLKKRVAWLLYQRRNLATAAALHATSDAEAADVAACHLGVTVANIPNGIDMPVAQPAPQNATGGIRTAVFVGRLHPVKGLPTALQAWADTRPEGWELLLAGPDEAGYRAVLEKEITRLDLGGSVRLLGAVDGQAKADLLNSASLFVLPSHSESFGMVVAEALSFGVPVLTTRGVPWPDLERIDCGWRVPVNDAPALAAALDKATSLPVATRTAMGQRGRDLVRSQFSWDSVAEQFLTLYASLNSGSIRKARS